MHIVELRSDSKLLKNNFDGYKLSLDPIPVLKLEPENSKPEIKRPNIQEQYSFLHQELFMYQNHLIADPWLVRTAYYVDEKWKIQRLHYDVETGKLKSPSSVFKLPKSERNSNDYNFDIKFVSEKFALCSDGSGKLYLFDTGDRLKNVEWKVLFTCHPLENEKQGFLIEDAKLQIENETKLIHCIFRYIEQTESEFETVLNWIVLNQTADGWQKGSTRILKGKGSVYYASFDPKCHGIVVSAKNLFKFTFDSVNPVKEPVPEKKEEKEEQTEPSVDNYSWTQNDEDITINFKEIQDAENTDYHVKCESKRLEVLYKTEILLVSELFGEIDADLTTWSLQNNFLQVTLVKKDASLVWPLLVPGGPLENHDNKQNQHLLNSGPVAHLGDQTEECDVAEGEDEYFIDRLDGTSHEVTHKVFLGQNPPMFSTVLRPGYPKGIAIRLSGIPDSCLFLQTFISDEWTLKHEGTLNAFGYVSASKKERKFTMCSPDWSYAVICESTRHLFIYKSQYDSASGLRRRSGPQSLIGQQKLVTFDGTNGEILGISVENDIILLLTEKAVLCLQMSIEE